MARIMLCHDVLNKISLHSKIMPIKNGELDTAKDWLDLYPADVLGIYDRGFASFEFLYLNIEKQKKFVIRYPIGFNKEVEAFVASEKKDDIVEFKLTTTAKKKLTDLGYELDEATTVKVRILRIVLDKYCYKSFSTFTYSELTD